MAIVLSAVEARVLGCLIEKETTTPDLYPLTLNSLTNACNQKSSRDPVMSLDDMTVLQALARLRDNGIVAERSESGSRVPKYAHYFEHLVPCIAAERAVFCILMLRGPQTPGEIRSRSERLHSFRDPAEVEALLQALMTRPSGALVVKLPRQTGFKESRYAHLLSGPPGTEATVERSSPASAESLESRVATLEQKVSDLSEQIVALSANFPAAKS
jgi:uncharacterized protein YceH (UPF0502 family)